MCNKLKIFPSAGSGNEKAQNERFNIETFMIEFSEIINMEINADLFKSAFYLVFSNPQDRKDFIKYLHTEELIRLNKFKNENAKFSYTLGRYAAKKSIACLTKQTDFNLINITNGTLGNPIVSDLPNLGVSLAHTDTSAVAVCFNEKYPMGIDIEEIDEKKSDIIKTQLTESESRLSGKLKLSETELNIYLWTAKEALSKALKTGFTLPMSQFEISEIEEKENHLIIKFKNMEQFSGVEWKINNSIISIVFPAGIKINTDYIEKHLQI
jgi:4'-phosphopantetheinyl transferase